MVADLCCGNVKVAACVESLLLQVQSQAGASAEPVTLTPLLSPASSKSTSTAADSTAAAAAGAAAAKKPAGLAASPEALLSVLCAVKALGAGDAAAAEAALAKSPLLADVLSAKFDPASSKSSLKKRKLDSHSD